VNPFGAIRRLVGMVFRRVSTGAYSVWRGAVPWYQNVSDVVSSSTVAVTLQWCSRNFPEAPPALWLRDADGMETRRMDHPLLRLLERPNPYFTGTLLWMATVTDWKAAGNAYWIIRRNGFGLPAELWWAPSWMMAPVGDEGEFVRYYTYTPNNSPLRVETRDVVHFRNGADPDDAKLGCSPLRSVLREVFTDDEAARFTASILTNMGVPGVVVSPDTNLPVKTEDLEKTQADIDAKFRGDRRGGVIVMRGGTRVSQFGFSPEQLTLKELRRIPEERVTAALGVPAIVVGLGAGLDRSTFTNMGEASEYAYSNGLIPDQRLMAETVRWSLLPEFEDDPFMWRFDFDLSNVRALQGDLDRLSKRLNAELSAGALMVAEHRRALGRPVDPKRDEVFLRQGNLTMVHGDGTTPPQPLAPASSNGNGNGSAARVAALV
jgi:HK97 family phage portal protein